MAEVTFQILDGMERGRIFADVPTPFTIGREEDNAIQLNDERVSRFHLKIQEDAGKVILTDLESTNGTRVNAVPTQLRVLQVGDLISIGRCLLVFGSPQEIAERFRDMSPSPIAPLQNLLSEPSTPSFEPAEFEPTGGFEEGSEHVSDWNDRVDSSAQQLAALPPPIPETFRLAQQAELTDLITYIHQRLQTILQQVHELNSESVSSSARVLPGAAMRQFLELEMTLARMIHQVSDPSER